MKPEFQPTPTPSSNIARLAHQGDTLWVEFHGGSVWKYSGVDHHLYTNLLAAPSIGKFFNELIKRVKVGEKADLSAPAA